MIRNMIDFLIKQIVEILKDPTNKPITYYLSLRVRDRFIKSNLVL